MYSSYQPERGWEAQLLFWSQSPSPSEKARCESTERQVRQAIAASPKLQLRDIHVFTQGSYRNRVNVRKESDVDVGVVCRDTFQFVLPAGADRTQFGITPATYEYHEFKNDLEQALRDYFGWTTVTRPGSKALAVQANTHRVKADVAPFFQFRRYQASGSFDEGVWLLSDRGESVVNWPEQHYNNGVAKNFASARRYKGMVRMLKCLRNEMEKVHIPEAGPIPGFLIECLVYNAPNPGFSRSTLKQAVEDTLEFLATNTITNDRCSDWTEVSEMLHLFQGLKPWTREQANAWLAAAWSYVGESRP